MKKFNVPRAAAPAAVDTLQVRGVTLENIDFVKDQAYELGYSSYGEYMNVLLNMVRTNAGTRVQKKGRQGNKKTA
jgi:hypothetical protein